jgi:hypothetical protein
MNTQEKVEAVKNAFFEILEKEHGERLANYISIGINLSAIRSFVPEEAHETLGSVISTLTISIINLADITEAEHTLALEKIGDYFGEIRACLADESEAS